MKHTEDEEKRMIANMWETPDGTILWSRHVHDSVFYEDANGIRYMVDGGNDYFHLSDSKEHPMKNRCIFNDAPWEVQRKFRLWGSSGMWIPVGCLSNEHIENIINDGYENDGVEKERLYRLENNIVIPEHDYTKEQALAITKAE